MLNKNDKLYSKWIIEPTKKDVTFIVAGNYLGRNFLTVDGVATYVDGRVVFEQKLFKLSDKSFTTFSGDKIIMNGLLLFNSEYPNTDFSDKNNISKLFNYIIDTEDFKKLPSVYVLTTNYIYFLDNDKLYYYTITFDYNNNIKNISNIIYITENSHIICESNPIDIEKEKIDNLFNFSKSIITTTYSKSKYNKEYFQDKFSYVDNKDFQLNTTL